MEREAFAALVARAVDNLPEEFKSRLDNVAVVVSDLPSESQLASVGLSRGKTLLGLYEGVPLTRRTTGYNLVLPDKITIFQKSLEAQCPSTQELKEEIVRTVKHEIAHYFGLDDERLEQIENGGSH